MKPNMPPAELEAFRAATVADFRRQADEMDGLAAQCSSNGSLYWARLLRVCPGLYLKRSGAEWVPTSAARATPLGETYARQKAEELRTPKDPAWRAEVVMRVDALRHEAAELRRLALELEELAPAVPV